MSDRLRYRQGGRSDLYNDFKSCLYGRRLQGSIQHYMQKIYRTVVHLLWYTDEDMEDVTSTGVLLLYVRSNGHSTVDGR